MARKRKLILEFIDGWADYLRNVKPDDTVFGPWLAVKDLPDGGFEAASTPLLKKFRGKAAASLLNGPAPKTLGEFASRYAKVLGDNKLLQDTAGPIVLKTPLPANPELFYPMDVARLSKANGELMVIQKTAPVPVMVLAVEEGAHYPEVKGDGKPRNLFVQLRGSYLTPGEEAPPIFPRILAGENQRPFVVATGEPLKPARIRHATAASGRVAAGWSLRTGSRTRNIRSPPG